jgi:hypothetical protein
VASVFNIAPPDPKWTKAEQAAYIPSEATLLFTSVHEVWPGHFLQFLHSNSNPSKLEAMWVGYAFAEGWAHYCEEMMHERRIGKDDPEKHIGQLTDALLRDVRLLSSIGLHTQGMTVAQSEKMFKEQAFQDPGNARQQAARGTYDPAYLNYTLGKLMIRKLRADWVAKTGAGGAAPAIRRRSGMISTTSSCPWRTADSACCARNGWARRAAAYCESMKRTMIPLSAQVPRRLAARSGISSSGSQAESASQSSPKLPPCRAKSSALASSAVMERK